MTTYNILDFNYIKAKQGALCIVVATSFFNGETPPTSITNGDSAYIGAGICSKGSNDRSIIIIGEEEYTFNRDGSAFSKNAEGYCLRLAEIIAGKSRAGNSLSTEGESFRDEAALSILREILVSMEVNPCIIKDNEILYYCLQAYRWADNMLIARTL